MSTIDKVLERAQSQSDHPQPGTQKKWPRLKNPKAKVNLKDFSHADVVPQPYVSYRGNQYAVLTPSGWHLTLSGNRNVDSASNRVVHCGWEITTAQELRNEIENLLVWDKKVVSSK